MGFFQGDMVTMTATKPSFQLHKGDVGVARAVNGDDIEVEWHYQGKPSRVVTVKESDITKLQKPKDVVGEGREALHLRQIVISLLGGFDTIEEAQAAAEKLIAIKSAAEHVANVLHVDIDKIGAAAAGILHDLGASDEQVKLLTESAKKHTLVTIGPSTLKRVYIDVDEAEAVRRYLVEHERSDIGDIPVSTLAIGDSFTATSISLD